MIKLKNLLKEGAVWDRAFGEPLPTLKGIMEKHNDCGCGGTTSCSCESVTEDVKDVVKVKKLGHKLGTVEGKLRKVMYDLEQRFQADTVNFKLQKPLKDSYKKHVTAFMRDAMSLIKKAK
jgi:hypothetical protein|tara:strand:- start:166 stop:525 length:360 start_codon:yes stop_codon:yes gene_type:complete